MLKRVLFPTDFSEVSEGILDWLVGLKEVGLKEIVLVRVINLTKVVGVTAGFDVDSWIKHEEKENEEKLAEKVKILEDNGIRASYVSPIPRGDPVSEIIKSAQNEKVSLIIIGSKGKGFLKEILMGSVSEGVVRKSPVPVMLVKPQFLEKEKEKGEKEVTLTIVPRNPFEKIVFAYDFSEYSKKVLEAVKGVAINGGKEVLIVNVSESGIEDGERDAMLKEALNDLNSVGVDAKAVNRVGTPYKEILNVAKEEDASVIMLGSRGLGFIQGALLGSTADSVVRNSEIPVIVFKY